MGVRHDTRVLAILKLYEIDFYSRNNEQDKVDQTLESFYEMEDELKEKKVNIKLYHDIIDSVMNNLDTIDQIIKSVLTGYSLSGLSYVDRAILRSSVAEMKFLNLPSNIAINEAIEISKDYSETDDFKSSSFNHKVLDMIVKKGLK